MCPMATEIELVLRLTLNSDKRRPNRVANDIINMVDKFVETYDADLHGFLRIDQHTGLICP